MKTQTNLYFKKAIKLLYKEIFSFYYSNMEERVELDRLRRNRNERRRTSRIRIGYKNLATLLPMRHKMSKRITMYHAVIRIQFLLEKLLFLKIENMKLYSEYEALCN